MQSQGNSSDTKIDDFSTNIRINASVQRFISSIQQFYRGREIEISKFF